MNIERPTSKIEGSPLVVPPSGGIFSPQGTPEVRTATGPTPHLPSSTSNIRQLYPFRHIHTAADVSRLAVLLREALTAIHFHRPGRLTVLNLACGRADETGALASALAPAEIGHYLGIDLRSHTIAEATQRWKLTDGLIEFRCGDASAIDRMKQLPAFDFIFIRHQNYWSNTVVWDRLLENAHAALAPGGVLACTSYFDREHELMKASLMTRGAELLWDVRNPASRPLSDAPGKSVDRHLAIFRKG